MLSDLAKRIWDRPEFQRDYRSLQEQYLQRQLILTTPVVREPLPEEAVVRLVQSAVHFSATSVPAYRGAAYRIATAALALHGAAFDNLGPVARFLLWRLGNFPTADMLFPERQTGLEGHDRLPRPLWFEGESHRIENSVLIRPDQQITLTDFQAKLWSSLTRGAPIAVSAPTSSGKSFALQQYLLKQVLGPEDCWCLYLAPTRALLHQVSNSLLRLLSGASTSVSISTVPVAPEELGTSRGIYVLTQERLQILNRASPELVFRLIVVDEAQTVADDSRGVLLQTVVESALARSSRTQVLFASPFVSNPEVFEQIFGLPMEDPIKEPESPVAQNLVFLDTDPSATNFVQVALSLDRQRVDLGSTTLGIQVLEDNQKLAVLSWAFGAGSKNLVYAGGPAQCEKISLMLLDLKESEGSEVSDATNAARKELADFIRDRIHPDYSLGAVVEQGIAFHYGNMPSIIRGTIEDYFSEGLLDFIVCTSTLLHGINLPAKNIFLQTPTKGKDTPLTSSEFWNLAGRAGRLGKDTDGTVFVIDKRMWKEDPLEASKETAVVPSLKAAVGEQTEKILSFAANEQMGSGRAQTIESVFVKLFNDFRSGRLDASMDRLLPTEATQQRAALRHAIEAASTRISVPASVTEQHTSVSVYRQQEMLGLLRKEIARGNEANVLPIHPLRREAYDALSRIFQLIHRHFEKKNRNDQSHRYFALLALRWMKGESMAALVRNAFDRRKKKAKRGIPKIDTVVRETFALVENDLRYRYVKYVRCYMDLLNVALGEVGREQAASTLPAIPLFLELGASSKTMISLIGLGLSRTSAEVLAEQAANKDMALDATRAWLERVHSRRTGMSPVVVREVDRALRR